MAAFTISTIQCTPDFTTSNRSASRIFAVPNTVLYSSLTPPVPEGVDGSAQCCTFLMPTAAGTPVPISVSGVASLLTSTRSFVLQGIWNTRVVFQTGALASPNTANFTVPINQLLFVGNPPLFPCRLPGNWAWAIGPPGGPMIPSAPVLLEITYVWAGPPAGPLNPPAGTLARPDFGGAYPVDLFRLFLPTLDRIPPPGTDLRQWYLSQSMRSIWGLGLQIDPRTAATRTLQYETIGGAPAYIEDNFGGIFELRRFINTMIGTVNCYDLAGITQLAMALIQTIVGGGQSEYLNSRWIFSNGFGYISPGPLIGWPQFPNCNSPFFSGSRLPFYFEPPLNTLRQQFVNHAWIEVTNTSGARVVVDATHCLQATPNTPESGTKARGVYLADQIDPIRPPTPRILDFNPASGDEQIGVTIIGTTPAFIIRPHDLTAEADTTSSQMVNNASFDSAAVLSIVRRVISNATIKDTDITVGSAGSQILIIMSTPAKEKEQFNVEISNYERLIDAVSEYNNSKKTLQRILPAEDFLATKPLGDDAIRTACSILFRRNALVVRVSTHPLPGSDINQVSLTTLHVSQFLDTHITTHAVQPGLEARPNPILRGDSSTSVVNGARFSLHLNNVDDASAVKIAEVADPKFVLSAGPGDVNGKYDFYAAGVGQTLVKLCVAHGKNLSVSATEVVVTVTAGEKHEIVSREKSMGH